LAELRVVGIVAIRSDDSMPAQIKTMLSLNPREL
jgi:hypothetical protein